MNILNKIVTIFLVLFIILIGVLLLSPKQASAARTYNCSTMTPQRYCGVPGGRISGYYTTSCSFHSGTYTWTCSGSDSSCTENQSTSYYVSLTDCQGKVNLKSTGCCNSTPGESLPKCNDCHLPDCPPPLQNTGDPSLRLENFRSCKKSGSCTGGRRYGDCYEVASPEPVSSIQIYPSGSTTLGCSSNTHTGVQVNNPIRMVSTHTDVNGADDIEAVYVWLQTASTTPATPKYIDLDSSSAQAAKTRSKDSYGFMMHKEGSNWVPYIGSITGQNSDKWVKATYSNNRFTIKGPSSQDMVGVVVNSISASGNSITFDFGLDYRNINEANRVLEGNYNIFVMANDVFGFTPNDNYPAGIDIGRYFGVEEIRYHRHWTDSGKDWIYDFTPPVVNSISEEVTGPTNIKFSWNIGDLRGLFGLVANVYASEGVESTDNITQVLLTSSGTKTVVQPYSLAQQGSSVIGHLENGYIARAVDIGGTSSDGNLSMNVGGNHDGSLVYYLTAFDQACNFHSSYSLYDLESWIVTYGGLLYSSTGVEFSARNIDDPNIWSSVSLLNRINPLYADLSSELYGNSLNTPSPLLKSSSVGSYNISPFTGFKAVNFYTDVKSTFERRESGISNLQRLNPNTSALTGSLGGDTIKVLDRRGNLTVGDSNPFMCNGKGIFFVSGNLIINNEILNSNPNSDSCIFVIGGDIVINPGPDSSGGSVGYDEINAYILANGSLTINSDSNYDGVYINGGIQLNNGVSLNRYLGLGYRNTHPVLVIDHHSKYGVFSTTLIGNPVDMVKTEVGFKPY